MLKLSEGRFGLFDRRQLRLVFGTMLAADLPERLKQVHEIGVELRSRVRKGLPLGFRDFFAMFLDHG